MEIQISRNIVGLYSRIVDSNLKLETRGFASLDANEKNVILLETYERIFKGFWNSPARVTNFKKDPETKNEEEELSVLKSVFPVASKNKAVLYTADLNFEFIPRFNRLKITVSNPSARNRKARDAYTVCLNRELREIKKEFEELCSPMHFVKAFFTTLKAHKLTRITGREAGSMYRIYTRALEHYPLFKKQPYERQVKIMQNGMRKTIAQTNKNRDIHLYAKSTFEVLASEKLISVLTGMDEFNTVYNAVSENRKTRRDYEHYNEIFELNCLIFVMYQYTVRGTITMQTSFSAFDLWNILI